MDKAPTNTATEFTAISSVADLGKVYNKETGIVTLAADAKWALTADITIKQLNLAGHSLTITTKDWNAQVLKHALTIESDAADKSLLIGGEVANTLKLENADFIVKSTASMKSANTINVYGGAFYLVAENSDIDLIQNGVTNVSGGSVIYTDDAKEGKGTVFDLKNSNLNINSDTGFQCVYFKLDASNLSYSHKTDATATNAPATFGALGGYFELNGDSTVGASTVSLYAAVIGKDAAFNAGSIFVYSGTASDVAPFWKNAADGMTMKDILVSEDAQMSFGQLYSGGKTVVAGSLTIVGSAHVATGGAIYTEGAGTIALAKNENHGAKIACGCTITSSNGFCKTCTADGAVFTAKTVGTVVTATADGSLRLNAGSLELTGTYTIPDGKMTS